MKVQICQSATNLSVCTYCDTSETVQCPLCKDRICTKHRVKVQGYAAEGAVDMCEACAKYIDTIVVPRYSQ